MIDCPNCQKLQNDLQNLIKLAELEQVSHFQAQMGWESTKKVHEILLELRSKYNDESRKI